MTHIKQQKYFLRAKGDIIIVLILIYTQFADGLTCEFLVELN